MTAEKKKQLQTLSALLVLLALVGAYTYWTNSAPSKGAAATPAEKVARVAGLPAVGNAQIRLDLLADNPDAASVGSKNLFQFYEPPPPPKPPAPPQTSQNTRPPAVTNPGPPPPPPAPPSALTTFKYDGVGIVAKPGKPVASISDPPTNSHYNVTEGEYILGRYRINKITENTVEIEDLDQNRRQTYPRITQQ